ncbi:MAG TPA: tripartite tricarboxylate transporter substrate-binding protein [Noviherbaspirillum sp.]|jgi:tripartite-type tricarboxylate transporter receptor subunit TctC|uniref:tripartite tricarboxylate transporter substrate-binding protein n=1 Tax=Noviherbaspirillum sp. TaxID=1926288 RepID=UPI002F937541
MKIKRAGSLVWLALAASPASYAADFPDKTITLIVPFAAGGPTDTIARLLAQAMGNNLKQQVIVENVGGAGGTIAAARVARSNPDGYTIFIHHVGHATAPSLYRKLNYSSIDSFEPIGLATDATSTLVARKDFPAKDVNELLSYLKANKEKTTLANAGIGAASHLCGMLFMSAIGTELTTVPYKGTGPAMNDLLGGQVDLMCDQATNTLGHIKSGKVKAYAVTYKTPVASLPDLPPLASAGLPGFELSVWHGLYAPKGTPAAVVNKLSGALQFAVKDPTVKQRLAELSTDPVAENRATPDALRAHLKAEIDKWGPIIRKAGIYAE